MKKIAFALIVFISFLTNSGKCSNFFDDGMREALKGLKGYSFLLKIAPESDKGVVTTQDVADYFELACSLKIPNLKRSYNVDEVLKNPNSKGVFVLNFLIISNDYFIDLTLYRWTTVFGNQQKVFVPVWSKRAGLLNTTVTPTTIRNEIEELVVKFAIDHLKANIKN